jgi:two-component system phosphate regulon response regulator PhoB
MQDGSKLILIVEDEPPLSDVLKDHFENEGFRIIVAKDGEEGLMLALSKKPDMILLDINLPKLNGLDMLKQLRTYEVGKSIPAIALTNLNDTKEVNEALASGVSDFLVKADWSIADVVDSVRRKLA